MINYELGIAIIDILFAAVIIIMAAISWYYVAGFFLAMKRTKAAPHSDKKTRFAVLIPARNESKVVKNIINSLKNQTYPEEYFDVWFITESYEDETNVIAAENGYNYFIRDELTDQRKTKGFALQECIRYFKANDLQYDAYMIFDADNVMDSDYLEKMNDLRQTGVEVGVGYRNFTNANTNWLTATSAILFTYMNSFTSKNRTILFKKALIAGTGYYVNSDIIDEAGGWIFTGMTEDTELTTYCEYHDINMKYYPLINFYDEQSPSFRANHAQHIRWIWGFAENRKRFMKGGVNHHATSKARNRAAIFEYRTSIIPFATACVLDFLLIVASAFLYGFSFKYDPSFTNTLLVHLLTQIGLLYFLFAFVAIATIGHNYNRLKLKWWIIVLAVLTYFFFFADLLFAFIHGLIRPKQRKTWKPIKHSGKIKDKRAKKVSKDGK